MQARSTRDPFAELTQLFFEMRQTLRANLPQGQADPNAWMRCETLRFIEQRQQPTMLDVARQLRITAPSATSLVRKLSSQGWVKRRPSGSDKRIVRIALTPSGARELARYRRRSEQMMRKVFSKLPTKDLQQLKRVLRTFNDIHRT